MNRASTTAEKLANGAGISLDDIKGTGNEGLITKADVERVIFTQEHEKQANATKEEGFTNIMDAQKHARQVSEKESAAPATAPLVELASHSELLAMLAVMQAELADLRQGQASLIARKDYDRDLTDDMFYLAKPGGHKWEERRVIDKRTTLCEFVGTAFFGPFKDQEMIDTYLSAKHKKREDSYLDWHTVQVMKGGEARALDRDEKAAREAHFQTQEQLSTNVLDQRMWASHGWGATSESGQGKVIGQAS